MNREEIVSKFQNGKLAKISRIFFLLMIFLAPLFFLPLTVLPVDINKQYMALFLTVFSFVFYLSSAISSKTIIYPRSPFAFFAFAIFISVGISSFFSDAKAVSFFGNLYQSDSFTSFLIYILAFLISSTLFGKKDYIPMGVAFIAGIVPALILGILQMRGFFYLPFEFTKNQGFSVMGTIYDYGFFISFVLVLAIAMLSEFKLKIIPKAVLFLASLLIFSNLVILNQRLLWAAVSIAMLMIVARKFTESMNPHNLQTASRQNAGRMEMPLVAMILSFLFFIISPSLPAFSNLPIQVKPNFSSTIDIAKYNFSAKNIMIGSGPSTFSYDFTLYRPTELNNTDFWSIRFNQGYSFLSTAVSTLGIFGTATLAVLVIYLAIFLVKNNANSKLFSISLGALFLAAGWFFSSSFFLQMLSIFVGLGLISSMSFSYGAISFEKMPKNFSFAIFIMIVTLITGSLAMLISSSQKYAAAAYYQKGLESKNMEDVLKNLDLAINFDPDSDLYLRTASQSLIMDANNEASKQDKNTPDKLNARIRNDIALSVQFAQKATVINPIDSLNWANLANVYEQIIPIVDGADMFAENNYKEALKRDPKNFELEFGLARTLIASADKIKLLESQKENKGETKTFINSAWSNKLDQANSALERSIALNKNYTPAHFQIAMIFARKNQTDKTIEKLEETKTIAPYDSGLAYQLGAVYYQNNEIERAKSELERAVALNEKYSNARYLLGLIYDKQGKKNLAIGQFEKISELNPDNEDIKKILSNLKQGKPIAGEKKSLPLEGEVSSEVLENSQNGGIGEKSNTAELPVETPAPKNNMTE